MSEFQEIFQSKICKLVSPRPLYILSNSKEVTNFNWNNLELLHSEGV